MSTESATYVDSNVAGEQHQYRSISKSAVASCAFAAFSVLALFVVSMVVVPFAGMVLAIMALLSIRRYPRELTGKMAAQAGLLLCGGLFIGSISWHTFNYVTEVPEGYQRISFSQLQPDDKPREMFPPRALDWSGEKVFLKGYVFPGDRRDNLKHFILVRGYDECCFGTEPAPTHMVEVTFVDPLRINYSTRLRNIGGTFKVHEQGKRVGTRLVFFELEADYLK